jgi:hypothetical protein
MGNEASKEGRKVIVETVRIVTPLSEDNPLGYIVINKDDLTEEHELYVETADPAAAAPRKGGRRKKADAVDQPADTDKPTE